MVCEQMNSRNRNKPKFRPNAYGIQYTTKVENSWGEEYF